MTSILQDLSPRITEDTIAQEGCIIPIVEAIKTFGKNLTEEELEDIIYTPWANLMYSPRLYNIANQIHREMCRLARINPNQKRNNTKQAKKADREKNATQKIEQKDPAAQPGVVQETT